MQHLAQACGLPVVVIGGSAGALAPLQEILSQLRKDVHEQAAVSERLVRKTSVQGLLGASRAHQRRQDELMGHAKVLRTLVEGTSTLP